jgi:large conductance mechanosensitive channel
MGFLKDFKAFAIKGNVVDLAVAVIIGNEFGKIINSLVKDIIMPPIGKLLNNTDFTSLFIVLDGGHYDSLETAQKAGAAVIAYGNFIQAIVNFLIIAFCIFLAVTLINKLRKQKEDEPAPTPPEDIILLREIRDSLKKDK